MAFDLKIACNLLPVINADEATILQLTDAIELYNSMLNDASKQNLINFVLKTRLSQNAKLRLNTSYETVEALVKDIKDHLLSKKSSTALQSKLSRAVQGNRSINEFGNYIENLFVNLTISQADGDNNAFKVLKSVNEKTAIKQFADGLRNQRLNTIIAARNFNSLKDCIRAALDESDSNTFGNSNQNQVLTMSKSHYKGFQNGSRPHNKQFNRYSNSYQQPNYSKTYNNNWNRGSHHNPFNNRHVKNEKNYRNNSYHNKNSFKNQNSNYFQKLHRPQLNYTDSDGRNSPKFFRGSTDKSN